MGPESVSPYVRLLTHQVPMDSIAIVHVQYLHAVQYCMYVLCMLVAVYVVCIQPQILGY